MKKISWVLSYVKGHWAKCAFVLLLSAIVSVLNVANAWCLQAIVSIGARESTMQLGVAVLITIGVVVGQGAANILLTRSKQSAIFGIAGKLKRAIFIGMQSIPFKQYESYHSGDLLTRLSDDAQTVAGIVPETIISSFIGGLLSCLVGMAYAFYLNWKLTLLVLVLTPLAILWTKAFMPVVERNTKAVREADSGVRAYTQEALTNPIVIRVYALRSFLADKFNLRFLEYSHAAVKQKTVLAVMGAGGGILGFLSFLASVSVGAYFVLQGEMTIGAVIGFIQLLNYIVWPFSELTQQIGSIKAAMVSVDRVKSFADTLPEQAPLPQQTKHAERPVGSIRLTDMSFSYKEGIPIFDHVNETIEGPGIVQIVGESGTGKTTLLKLLLGLYEPDGGSISIAYADGEVESALPNALFSYVPQEHVLFSGTIRENIKLGKLDATDEEVENAAKRAQIHSFITSLPDGYDTVLTEGAHNLSFGQTQRIAISRALLKNSPILIMDEPTASLDVQTKLEVLGMLKQEAKGKLCILVSHDESSSQFADALLHIEHGKLVKRG